jgi:FlaG/FlaF family flagellin (archaellin)
MVIKKLENKKGLSTVIATVLLILLVVVATGIVWAFVNNIVTNKTAGVQSCFDVTSSPKVTLNGGYTCYINATNGEVQFSVDIGDAQINGLAVSIAVGGNSKTFTLTNEDTVIPNLKPYGDSYTYSDPVKLPGKNEGRTYVASGFNTKLNKVDSIKIAPIVEKQCDLSDQTYQIDDCALFTD